MAKQSYTGTTCVLAKQSCTSKSHQCDKPEISDWRTKMLFWFVCCLVPQQHASVSQEWIWSDSFTCCHPEIEFWNPTFYLTQSQYADTNPTSPTTDPVMPGNGSVASGVPIFLSSMTPPGWKLHRDSGERGGTEPKSADPEVDTFTTRPTRWSEEEEESTMPMAVCAQVCCALSPLW